MSARGTLTHPQIFASTTDHIVYSASPHSPPNFKPELLPTIAVTQLQQPWHQHASAAHSTTPPNPKTTTRSKRAWMRKVTSLPSTLVSHKHSKLTPCFRPGAASQHPLYKRQQHNPPLYPTPPPLPPRPHTPLHPSPPQYLNLAPQRPYNSESLCHSIHIILPPPPTGQNQSHGDRRCRGRGTESED
jgi:hypothetical protein